MEDFTKTGTRHMVKALVAARDVLEGKVYISYVKDGAAHIGFCDHTVTLNNSEFEVVS